MAKTRYVAGVDIGSTKICVLVAEEAPDGCCHIVDASIGVAEGIQRGAVADLESAASAVARVLDRISLPGHSRIETVILGTSAAAASLNSRGTFVTQDPDRALTVEDVRRAVGTAADAGLPGSRQVIQAIPRRFVIDGQTEVSNPVGLFGRRLDTETHVVTMAGPTVRSLIACVERWGAEVEEVVAQPLAAAVAVLAAEDRELGAVVADLGAGSTGLAVFVDGNAWQTSTIPVGGRHITQDIAVVMGLVSDVAEDLKVTAGHAVASDIDESETLQLREIVGGGETILSRRQLSEIIEARALELIGLIGEEIRRSGYAGLLPGGLVLTGGTAQLPGIAKLASEELQMRVRVGQPGAVSELGLNGPACAGAIGLLRWGAEQPGRGWWTNPALTPRAAAPAPNAPRKQGWLKTLWSPVLGNERPRRRESYSRRGEF